jgi:hypothetical protein
MYLTKKLILRLLAMGVPMVATPTWAADLPMSRDALFDLESEADKSPASPDKGVPPALPATRDALFDLAPEPAKAVEKEGPASRDALFDLAPGPAQAAEKEGPATREALLGEVSPGPGKQDAGDGGWHGFFQGELAYTYASPDHWSKVTGRLELDRRGRWANGTQWKLGARVDYNAVFDVDHFYDSSVRNDQGSEFLLRENYLDIPAGDWDFRLGRQHIVWGEMVGLFFADVVSAKDMREFVLQDFQLMRIPQWATRAEYFKDDFHAELIWIPYPGYNEVGKPGSGNTKGQFGSDFYAYPLTPVGISPVVLREKKPADSLSNTNYGLRLSQLVKGWDIAGFLYSSMDSSPTAYVVDKSIPGVYRYELRHKRIHQAGGTLAKDLGDYVLKAEAIYTNGRRYNVTDATDADGVVEQDTVDWVVGLDFNPWTDTRFNTQFFQRVYFDHDKDIFQDRVENGFSLLLNQKLTDKVEAEALLVSSLNRSDWMFRPKLSWNFQRNWKWLFGVDIFSGPQTGLFRSV